MESYIFLSFDFAEYKNSHQWIALFDEKCYNENCIFHAYPMSEVATYMLEHNCKLEQEAIDVSGLQICL